MYKHMCVDICSYPIDPLHRVKGHVRRAFCNCHRQPGARPGAASGLQPGRPGGIFRALRAGWALDHPAGPCRQRPAAPRSAAGDRSRHAVHAVWRAPALAQRQLAQQSDPCGVQRAQGRRPGDRPGLPGRRRPCAAVPAGHAALPVRQAGAQPGADRAAGCVGVGVPDRLRPAGADRRADAAGDAADLAPPGQVGDRRSGLLRRQLLGRPADHRPHVPPGPLQRARGGDHRHRLLHRFGAVHGDHRQDPGTDAGLEPVLLGRDAGDLRRYRRQRAPLSAGAPALGVDPRSAVAGRREPPAPSLMSALRETFLDGLRMTAAILPSILAVGLLGLLAAKYTPLFDAIGVLLYPLTWLFGLSEPMEVARAIAAGLAEMFLPAMLLKDAEPLVKFVTAIVSVSSVLFLSASIPCVLATRIPLRLRDLLLVWLQRTLLSLVFSIPLAYLAQYMGWL